MFEEELRLSSASCPALFVSWLTQARYLERMLKRRVAKARRRRASKENIQSFSFDLPDLVDRIFNATTKTIHEVTLNQHEAR